MLEDQADRSPDSKSSAKITSDELGVFVLVGIGVDVGVFVSVGDGPMVAVAVAVAVARGVFVRVAVTVGVDVAKGVFVGVKVVAEAVLDQAEVPPEFSAFTRYQ